MPVSIAIAQVALLGLHVADGTGLHPGQFFLVNCCANRLDHLSLRASSQYQIGLFEDQWKIRPDSRRVEADRGPQLGIPKFGIVEAGSPRSLHHAHETVRTSDGSFIAMFPRTMSSASP